MWTLNFTAPNLQAGTAYDLNVTANFTNITILHYAVESEAIIYTDVDPPLIEIFVDALVPVNTSTTIRVNVTDSGGIENTSALIIYPDSSNQTFNLTFIERIGIVSEYELIFSLTLKGFL